MDGRRSTSPKRWNDDEVDYDAPARKRSSSPATSPSYKLAERPARRYSREDSENDRHYYRDRKRRRSRSKSHTQSRSRSCSRSNSSRQPSRSPITPAASKPTELHYKPTLLLRGHKKAVSAVKFSPDGRWIASASADCTIKIWDASTGTLEHSLEGHLAGISTISWSPDSRILASGSDDKSIRLWDTRTGLAHPTPFVGHHNYIYSLAFSPKGNMLVSGSYDEAVYVWDVRAARVMRSLPAHSDPVSGVDFVRDGTLIVSCSHDGLIRVWDTATGQCLRTLVHEDNAAVSSVIFSPNGKYVLAWTLDSCIRLWNYIDGKGKCVKTYQGHVNKKYSLSGAFGTYNSSVPSSRRSSVSQQPIQYSFIASGSEEGPIFLWDVGTKNILQRLEGHTEAVLALDTHLTEKLIASAGLDGSVRLWREDLVPAAAQESEEDDGMDEVEREEEVNGYDPDTLPPDPFE